MKRVAIFPGSFDPFTIGHQAIVDRALQIFDGLVIAFGINRSKKPYLPLEDRVAFVKALYAGDERVVVLSYDTMTCDLAAQYDAKFIIRGVRSISDYEYERMIADANMRVAGLETVFLIADPFTAHISSSLVCEMASFGKDPSKFLPKLDAEKINGNLSESELSRICSRLEQLW